MVSSYDGIRHDSSRVTGDFNADFPVEEQPALQANLKSITITKTITFTGSEDADNPKYYNIDSIRLSGSRRTDLVIAGHVVLVVSGDISITGSGGLVLNGNSSFHFDEALRELSNENNLYSINRWYEVQSQNKATQILVGLGAIY